VREPDRDVRLAATERRREHRRLQKPLESRRAETQHEFAECHNSKHDGLIRVP
jgi:hypothetical protein